jgi:hypothetical protein
MTVEHGEILEKNSKSSGARRDRMPASPGESIRRQSSD